MNKKEIISLRSKTLDRLKELLDRSVGIYIKSHKFYELCNPNNADDYSGILLEIHVNRKLHYYDILLNEWKKQLNAAEFFVTYKQNALAICFKIKEF